MVKKIAYLGPQGTFSEVAVKKYFKEEEYDAQAYPSIHEVFSAVLSGEREIGVLPIENSCEGTINQVLDLLAYGYTNGEQDELKIIGEVIIPIRHSLLTRLGKKPPKICTILSHPQALAQCRGYILKNYPDAQIVETASTADAIKTASLSNRSLAAIGMAYAAEYYGMIMVDDNINDYPGNETRFIVFSKEEEKCTVNCKTSLLVNVQNQPGALYQLLKEFSLRGINLTKIESRPAKTKVGEYLFFIDIDGHHLEPKIKTSLEEINKITEPVKVLGSYQGATRDTEILDKARESIFTPSLDNLRNEVDILDEQIIEMLGRRTTLVEKIGDFKASVGKVHDPQREEWILERLSSLAEKKGFSPSVTIDVYKILFEHFVQLQKEKKIEDSPN